VEWSQKSSIPNETINQRGFAVVSIYGDHNVVTTSKKGTNQRIKEKTKSTPKSTRKIPSSWETIDSQFPESQSSPPKKYSQPRRKGVRLGISPRSSIPTPTPVPVPKPILVPRIYDPSNPTYYIPKFMRPYIDKIVDVIGNGNCGFRDIAESMGLTEEIDVMVRSALIQEVKEHRNDYINIYAGEGRYNFISNGLHPTKNGSRFAPPDKWLTLPDMGHIVASYYSRPVVEITTLDIGVSETFFHLEVGSQLTRKATSFAFV
jgi:hypothetical protein